MYTIMIIDDNEQLQNEIGNIMIRNGYSIIKPKDFSNIPYLVKENKPSLILLDINLPESDGFKICTEIRSFSNVPIIFITSRDTNIDELMGITLGGDDFITKPYNTQILLARIASIIRRTYQNLDSEVFEFKGLKYNMSTSEMTFDNKKCELTKNESKILFTLMKNKERIVSRNDLMKALWQDDEFVDDNTLTVNINRLRKKLEEIGAVDYIQTKRGQGYILI